MFQSKHIDTASHIFLGTKWPFRGCEVDMYVEGFVCNCQKQPRIKCNHIKSVELGILGVNSKEFKTDRF
jgi:hypothetical protein